MIYLLVVIEVILVVFGQILWKLGLENLGGIKLDNLWGIILSPYIIAGLALYIIATGLWFVILSKSEFSAVYPLQSLAYVLGVFAGLFIFKEYIPFTRWLGSAVIILGVYLVALK